MSTCTMCHRGLKDPGSIQRGYGPICWAKLQAERGAEEAEEVEKIEPQYWEVTEKDLPAGIAAKTYIGVRKDLCGGQNVYVEQGGERWPLRHIMYHSPTGFEWGYGGSGPADLARSILANVAGIKFADMFYQEFKWKFIECQPREGFRIAEREIREWLKEAMQQKIGGAL